MKPFAIKASLLLLNLVLISCQHTETLSPTPPRADATIRVDPQVHETHKLRWTPLSLYVGMNVPYAPIAAVKKEVEKREGVLLQSRGEAHITVISPSELSALRSRLSLEQINGTMAKLSLQSIPFQLHCLGKSQLKEGERRLAAYYLLVQAPGLLQVREKLRQQFAAAGGDKQAFVVEDYQPHITVGFTERDLNPEDGVSKDGKSCVYKVE
ncbi:2'-5' RNA ligase family protein [Oligoflexus tunisiensis]|uniref:2'-5' RNA ligase family protein n=1 Tax=Oligoflexus tunisiensis TaxID=708132 RepID=UPI000A7045CC|nr:2'-5' RNA ligase family protein [Oligoflexus tunisiensis]